MVGQITALQDIPEPLATGLQWQLLATHITAALTEAVVNAAAPGQPQWDIVCPTHRLSVSKPHTHTHQSLPMALCFPPFIPDISLTALNVPTQLQLSERLNTKVAAYPPYLPHQKLTRTHNQSPPVPLETQPAPRRQPRY